MRTPKRALLTAAAGAAAAVVALGVTSASATSSHHDESHNRPKPTVVLVHGAWADGSSWAAVTSQLQRAGYPVDVIANPLRGVASDARYLRDQLAAITGPIVLVGHSYGGMVISGAANPNVKALVYVDAYIPDDGDTVGGLTAARPGSTLDPATSTTAVGLHDADGNVVDADVYIKPAQFPGIFTGDLPARTAAVLAASQRPLAFSALSETFTGTPAWKTVPSWDLIGTADKLLPPAEQEIMAQRAGAHVVKIDAPHLSMVADPDAAAAIITHAAQATG